MAFTTYTELKAAIAARASPGGASAALTALIPDFITLAEKRLNHVLNLTEQELEATLTATTSSRSLTLPSGFGSPIALYLTTYLPRIELEYRLPTEMQYYSGNGAARNWTIDGSTISTDSPADQAYTYTLRYVAEYDIATTSTNNLLTKYPETYFYGALIEAFVHSRDDKGLAFASARYAQAVQECKDDSNANRKLAKLTTEISGSGHSRIITGD